MSKKIVPKSISTTMEQKLYLTLYKLSKLHCSQAFLNPVDTNLYQDYLPTIQNPMDLTTIIGKLKNGQYHYLSQVHDDLRLICKNCYLYNKDKVSSQFMEKILGKFVKSMDLAWAGLKKQLADSGIQQDKQLPQREQIMEKIQEIQQRIKLLIVKKVERLSNDSFLDSSVVMLGSESEIARKKKDRIPEKLVEKNSTHSSKKSHKSSSLKKPNLQVNNQIPEKFLQKLQLEEEKQKVELAKKGQSCSIDRTSKKSNKMSQIKYVEVDHSENHSSRDDEVRKDEKQQSQCTVSITKPFKLQIKSCTESIEIQDENPEIEESYECKKPVIQISIDKQNESEIVQIEDKTDQNSNTAEIQIRREQFQEQLKNTVKKKLHKYQRLIQNYLIWMLNNIINVKATTICTEHSQQAEAVEQADEEKSMKQCIDCIQIQKEQKLLQDLKSLLSYKYLSGFLDNQLGCLKKGDLDLRKLLKLLEEFNYWLTLLAAPYINWRTKENYIEVQKCILICLEKIIEYKQLGPEFIRALDQPKQQVKKCLDQKYGRRITRSRGNLKKSDESETPRVEKYSILSRLNARQKSKFKLNQQKIHEHEQLFNLLEVDQVKCDLKIVIFRDLEDANRHKVLDKSQYLIRKKKLLKKDQELSAEELEDEVEQEEYSPDEHQIKQINRIFKKPRLNQIQVQAEQRHQENIRIRSQRQNDEQFLKNYSLRSNALVIQKYKERLQLDWDTKWKNIFGEVPNRLAFDDQQTKISNFEQENGTLFCF